MDWDTIKDEIIILTDKNIQLSYEYRDARRKYAQSKYMLDIKFSLKISEIREKKSNIGYEMGLITLMEVDIDNEIKDYYQEMLYSEADFKGYEKLIEANQAKISLYQSILKYIKEV